MIEIQHYSLNFLTQERVQPPCTLQETKIQLETRCYTGHTSMVTTLQEDKGMTRFPSLIRINQNQPSTRN
jgi:hypothetical protein